MKQLLSQLTMVLLSVLVLLLTVAKEGESRKTPGRNEISSPRPVEQTSQPALARTEQDSLIEDPSFMLSPLKGGILAGKTINLLIY